MKKPLLKNAISIAISSTLLSATLLLPLAHAEAQMPVEPLMVGNNNSIDSTTETYLYPGMGAGAATGVLLGGPAGLLIGGLLGAIIGVNQDVVAEPDDSTLAAKESTENKQVFTVLDGSNKSQENNRSQKTNTQKNFNQNNLQLAQIGNMPILVEDSNSSQQDAILNILTSDLSMDIYFRSGSTNIEAFYPSRLAAIAALMNTVEELELHLDGYSDRRGNKVKNITLSKQRIDKVREQLINAGVDETRIVSKAFGEMKMVSAAGDLEAYTFDRKVVIRFERSSKDSIHAMTKALSETSDTNSATTLVTDNNDSLAVDTATRF